MSEEEVKISEEEAAIRELARDYAEFKRRLRLKGIEIPQEFEGHLRSARREVLLALRSLLDERIKRLEESEARPRKVTRVPVE